MESDLKISFSKQSIITGINKLAFLTIGLVLALVFLADTGTWLFPVGKDVVFKIVVKFLLLLFLTELFVDFPKISFRKNLKVFFQKINIQNALILFIFSAILSTLFSIQPSFSFWGNIYKNMGLFSLLHFTVFFFLTIFFVKNSSQWKHLIYWISLVILGISIITIFQALSGISRPAATLDNPDFLSSLLTIVIPLFLFLGFFENISLFKITSIASLTAVFLTQARSAILATIISLIIILWIKKPSLRKQIILFVSAGILFSVVIVFSPPGKAITEHFPPFLKHIFNYHALKSSFSPRWHAWQAGLKAFQRRPLFGYGLENFPVAFDNFYQGIFDHSGSLSHPGSLWQTWFDRAHNFIIEIASTMGIVGLLAYLLFFTTVISKSLKLSQKNNLSSFEKHSFIGIAIGFLAYLIQNLFNFDTTSGFLYVIFLSAFVAKYQSTKHPLEKIKPSTKTIKKPASFIIITALAITLTTAFLFFKIISPEIKILRANHFLNKAEMSCRLAQILPAKSLIDKCFQDFELGLNVNSPSVNRFLRWRYGYFAVIFANQLSKPSFVVSLEPHLKRALFLQQENSQKDFPYFTRNYIFSAQIAAALYKISIIKNSPNLKYFHLANKNFLKSIQLSPGRASIYVEWARFLASQNKTTLSNILLKRAKEINPKIKF